MRIHQRQFADHFLPRNQQQPLQALAQVLGIERLDQIGSRGQRQGGAHTRSIRSRADQDECLTAAHLARRAQHFQTVSQRQLLLHQRQDEGLPTQRLDSLRTIAYVLHIGIATDIQHQLPEQIAAPGIGGGDQYGGRRN
ncbi:hypothetical protein D3C78_1074170 [compost metagenome]